MKRTNKTVAILLVLVMALTLLPMTALAADIQSGVPALTVNSTTQTVMFAGQEWYVIGNSGSGVYQQPNSVTLLLKGGNPYGNTAFRSGQDSDPIDSDYHLYAGWWYQGLFSDPSDYNDSTLMRRMAEIASGFPSKELTIVNARTLTSASDGIGGANVSSQKLWPLSQAEWSTIGNDAIRSFGTYYWLRSPHDVIIVLTGGSFGDGMGGSDVHSVANATRPAINLDLTSVIFTSSAAAGGKSSATVGSGLVGATAPTGPVKFTVTDSIMATPTLTLAGTTNGTSNISFGYTGAATGPNQYVSCVLEQIGTVTHYGKLADCVSQGSGSFIIDTHSLAAGTYTLKVFSEQANGDNNTDFSSTQISMTLTVDASGNGMITGAPNTESTAPIITAGAVNRTSDTNATVKFTGDEAGTYYYQIDGAVPTAVSLTAAGTNATSLTTTEQTITLTTLTAGAQTIYIAAKDTAGNVSNLLMIIIPAYTPLSSAKDITAFSIPGQVGDATITDSGKPTGSTITLTMPSGTDVTNLTPAITHSGVSITPNSGVTQNFSNPFRYTVRAADGSDKEYYVTVTVTVASTTTYSLTVSAGAGGTVSGTSSGNYTAGYVVNVIATPNSGYLFTGWTVTGVILGGGNYSFLADFPMPSNAVTLTANFAGDGTDASINPTFITFDKNTASADYKDISITLNPGSYALSAIRFGGYNLQAGTDYTVNGNTYTFKKEYLATLGVGVQTFIFDMSGGADPALTITVKDTTQVVNTNIIDLPKTGDDTTMIGWGLLLGTSVLGILCALIWRKRRQLRGTW